MGEDATMPTGSSVVATCPARAALAGNPSDGYGGVVVAVPIPELCATAAAAEDAHFAVDSDDAGLIGLLGATAAEFEHRIGPLPPRTLSVSTAIPRSVGLAGSSAIVIAALRALAACTGHRWDRIDLAEAALAVEHDRLGITAGLQDRLVQAVGRPVAMTFDPVHVEPLEVSPALPLFVAWSNDAAEHSGIVHRSLRERYDAGDTTIHRAMTSLAVQGRRAERALRDGDTALLADAMNRTFELRASMVDVGARQRHLVDIAQRLGAAANSAGSGGSVVGLARAGHDRLDVERAYRASGHEFIWLTC